jgi:DNA-binding HxlR family transcriptional regulator
MEVERVAAAPARAGDPHPGSGTSHRAPCRAREVLDLVADKWSLYVVSFLGDGPRRFTELKRGIDGINQRMLTVTLRGLERDGILTRTVYNVMPPHVAYELTPMGAELLTATTPLITWSEHHLADIDSARNHYDNAPRSHPPVRFQGSATPVRTDASLT